MRVTPSATTFGPASASAGGVTVTAKVSSIRWDMGDGTTAACAGRGTRYAPSRGKTMSPDWGHRYKAPSTTRPGEK
ncbi:hypothetical protein [Streptomyces sp. NPDC056242]|uniref:hypothetical protein n=1 Tax=Streptomyces sp. NPDC056242 TaxID=3345760 RepID=UPI0035E0BFEC